MPTETQLLKVNRTVLPNGLRFVHHYMADTAMVTLNVLYNVGARFEHPDKTGLAHLFEHIMFGGSQNVADFDGVLTSAGGVSNAWTGNDFTNFYAVAPAHNAETLFYLESDRMLSPAITESTLQVQRSVVIEEFKQQCLNRPYGDMMHSLRQMVYGAHPYSWPVIGKDFQSLEKITRDDVLQWWKDHYAPENAVLSVAGNIDFEKAAALASKWFGSIPARLAVKHYFEPVAELAAKVEKTVYGAVPSTMIVFAFLMDRYGTDDFYAADALTDILASGQSSRFYQKITMNPASPLADADASILGSEDRGMLMLTARLVDETTDVSKAADYLLNVARTIVTEGVTAHELERVKNKQHSMFIMNNLMSVPCAQTIAEAEMHGEEPGYKLERYNSLTTDMIGEVARRIFDESHPAVLYYRPTIN